MISSTTTQPASSGGITGAVSGVLSAASPIGAVLTGLNQVASIFGLNSSDPVKDQQRIDRINFAFDLAIRGDNRPQTSISPSTNLEGMSGADYLKYIATNNMARGGSDGAPVYGSQIAYRYAEAKYAEYQARVAAGRIGVGLIGESDIPAKVEQFVQSTGLPMALIAVVVIVGLIWYVRRKGK